MPRQTIIGAPEIVSRLREGQPVAAVAAETVLCEADPVPVETPSTH